MKKGLLFLLQNLAASIFIGISVYGAIIYFGGEAQKKIPVKESLLLGLGAVVCVFAVVAIGGLLDKIASAGEAGKESDREIND